MGAVTAPASVRELYRTWWTRGTAPRALPPEGVRVVYGLWVLALVFKLLGSSWDVAWHFKWLRDDLAPPHLINTAGTALVVALVLFHTYTGYGVDRAALRLMQAGTLVFLGAVPIDVINHRLNGLDITAWSATHALLYVGTVLMLAGVLCGWARCGAGLPLTPVLVVLWALVLEAVWFPTQQQEYGGLAVAAWDRGRPTAEPILLQFAADQLGRPVDRAAVLQFALPVPAWLYPLWLIAVAGLVLVLARWMIGRRWAATAVAVGYVAYRCVAWLALVGADFPPSAVPVVLVALGVAVDAAFAVRMPVAVRPLIGSALVGTAAVLGLGAQEEWLAVPPVDPTGLLTGTLVLAVLWIGAALVVRWNAPTSAPASPPPRP
jgi:hypothetical protein